MSKTGAFLQVLGLCSQFVLPHTAVFSREKNKRKSPKNVKNWRFLAIFFVFFSLATNFVLGLSGLFVSVGVSIVLVGCFSFWHVLQNPGWGDCRACTGPLNCY